MDAAAFLTELNIRTGDTDNFTFTPEEKAAAITRALNDSYLVSDVWDDSLTYTTNTYQYAVPAGVDVVRDIYIRADTSSDPQVIDSKLWKVVADNIQFQRSTIGVPEGYTLYIKGYVKYSDADTITDYKLQEYVLANSILVLYSTLLNKRNFRFLKNDTSVPEIVATKREMEQEVARYRRELPKDYQVA